MSEPVLEVRSLTVDFAHRAGHLGAPGSYHRALDDVSFSATRGEKLGIVGESGSGKSTLCKSVAGVYAASSGEIRFHGQTLPARRSPELRRAIQIVFQDPYTSLNPRRGIGSVLEEAVRAHRTLSSTDAARSARELLTTVGLPQRLADARPAKLSGGQRQRVAIARALAVDPEIVLADEVTSALDVSVQAVIVDLLGRLTAEREMTLVFVTHNLQVVRALCNRICVMHAGRIVETAPTEGIFASPRHPYTRALPASCSRPLDYRSD
jgi:ABC-type glutathione transport system ATPase component